MRVVVQPASASVRSFHADARYLYNGLGQRVSKTVRTYSSGGPFSATQPKGAVFKAPVPLAATGVWRTNTIARFVFDDNGTLMGEYDAVSGVNSEYVWFNGRPVAVVIGGTVHDVNTDQLGTPRSIVKASNGVEVWRWDSDPFGTTPPSYPVPAQSIIVNLRLPGQYYDLETGLHYNGMRDYHPSTGRYTQSDPIGLAGGINTYTYVDGNPISMVDPYGLFGWADMPTVPQNWVDFGAGMGDVILFGQGQRLRDLFDVGGVDRSRLPHF